MGIAQSTLRQLFWMKEKLEAAPKLNPKLPKPSSSPCPLDPGKLLRHPEECDLSKALLPIGDAPLLDFDPGVLGEELLHLKIFQTVDPAATPGRHSSKYAGGNIVQGTYDGTQAALTQIYSRLERSYESYFDCLAIEPTLPRFIDLEEKRKIYQWSSYPLGEDGKPAAFPPHLQHIPREDDVALWKIFNALGLAEASLLLQKVTPDDFLGKTADWILEKARCAVDGTPQVGVTIKDVEDYNKWHRKSGTDIAQGENIGLLDDWFSDRRFADQAFTGANPKTIERASAGLVEEFTEAAKAGGYDEWAARLPRIDAESLLVQDCSYFREAIGAAAGDVIHHRQPASDENWACAAVTLFQLHDDGKLHPVAITIDYKGTMADSVTIFNQRMSPADPTRGEATDWPWRYAKTCAQVSDWYRHEITVHLTETHFVEEAIIVATNRTVPMDHVVFRVLQPHWYKTLSLNAAGRTGLIPDVFFDVVGTSPEQGAAYIRHAYERFDFVGNYVPNQLRARGFPADAAGLDAARYRNYPYAKNMVRMWAVLRRYVEAMLATHYGTGPAADARVAGDAVVAAWGREVREAGGLASFPTTTTLAQLADAVTMCVHLAAPMHTAVNYLQNFYQGFVAAKPASLCAAPPATLAALRAYAEPDLVAALPLNRQRQWMLQSTVPWLLSSRVAADRSLRNLALSQWKVHRRKTAPRDAAVRDAAATLYADLDRLSRQFYHHSRAMDEGSIPYMVMDPSTTAVSILI